MSASSFLDVVLSLKSVIIFVLSICIFLLSDPARALKSKRPVVITTGPLLIFYNVIYK
jgi:hypothetical protein